MLTRLCVSRLTAFRVRPQQCVRAIMRQRQMNPSHCTRRPLGCILYICGHIMLRQNATVTEFEVSWKRKNTKFSYAQRQRVPIDSSPQCGPVRNSFPTGKYPVCFVLSRFFHRVVGIAPKTTFILEFGIQFNRIHMKFSVYWHFLGCHELPCIEQHVLITVLDHAFTEFFYLNPYYAFSCIPSISE